LKKKFQNAQKEDEREDRARRIVSAKFPRLLIGGGRRGFASKALDYSRAVWDFHFLGRYLPAF